MDPETTNGQVPPPAPITNSLRTIRTFKGDVEEGMASGKTTVVSMAAAETERRAREAMEFENKATEPIRKAKIIGLFIFALSLVLILSGLFYYFLGFSSKKSEEPAITPPSYIYSEQYRLLNLSGAGGDQVVSMLGRARQETTGQLGSIVAIVPVETGEGASRSLLGSEFLNLLDPETPEEVTRTLQGPFLFGIHVFDGNQPFFIFKPDTYETSFAGMLSWESSMPFRLGRALRPATDWSGASSTLTSVFWSDAVINNKDTRILRSKEGETLLLYSFIDRGTLVITTNEQTFGEVIRRVGTVRSNN